MEMEVLVAAVMWKLVGADVKVEVETGPASADPSTLVLSSDGEAALVEQDEARPCALWAPATSAETTVMHRTVSRRRREITCRGRSNVEQVAAVFDRALAARNGPCFGLLG